MGITWNAENYGKLLAALLAAHPEFKPNYKAVAACFGEGATYDAIQGCLRPINKKAEAIRKEIAVGVRPSSPPKGTPRKRKLDDLKKIKRKDLECADYDAHESGDEFTTPTKKLELKVETSPSVFRNKKVKRKPVAFDSPDSDDEMPYKEKKMAARKVRNSKPKTVVKLPVITAPYESEDDYYE